MDLENVLNKKVEKYSKKIKKPKNKKKIYKDSQYTLPNVDSSKHKISVDLLKDEVNHCEFEFLEGKKEIWGNEEVEEDFDDFEFYDED